MPNYEYECQMCKARLEVTKSISEPHPTGCPTCKNPDTLEQLIGAPSVHFKGKGWYHTDYKGKNSSS